MAKVENAEETCLFKRDLIYVSLEFVLSWPFFCRLDKIVGVVECSGFF